MRSLAACFRDQLGMTNGCLPASLLLHEVLTQRGVPCRLRSGFVLFSLPGATAGAAPTVGAAAHMWVEAQDCGATAALDIGGVLAEAAGALPGLYRLSPTLPAGATRLDLGDPQMGPGASLAEAAMATFAGETDPAELRAAAEMYWGGAPPPLQAFRRAMLQQFGQA